MVLILIFVACIVFFPAVIFFDYNKKKNIHRAIWFLVFFVLTMTTVFLAVQVFKFSIIYLLPLFPFVLLGVLYIKKKS